MASHLTSSSRSESSLAAELERLALESRNIRRTIEHARTEADKRVLNKQLAEAQKRMDLIRASLKD